MLHWILDVCALFAYLMFELTLREWLVFETYAYGQVQIPYRVLALSLLIIPTTTLAIIGRRLGRTIAAITASAAMRYCQWGNIRAGSDYLT
jgi:hypothetical protein